MPDPTISPIPPGAASQVLAALETKTPAEARAILAPLFDAVSTHAGTLDQGTEWLVIAAGELLAGRSVPDPGHFDDLSADALVAAAGITAAELQRIADSAEQLAAQRRAMLADITRAAGTVGLQLLLAAIAAA